MDPASSFVLQQLLAYLISLAAGLRGDALAEKRAKSLEETLAGAVPPEPFAHAASCEQMLQAAAVRTLTDEERNDLTPNERRLFQFFAVPANAGMLAAWLRAPGAKARHGYRSQIERALGEILEPDLERPDLMKAWFDQVEICIFSNSTLSGWLAHEHSGLLHDKVDRMESLLEALVAKVGTPIARHVAVLWLRPEDPNAELSHLLARLGYEHRLAGNHQFERMAFRIAQVVAEGMRDAAHDVAGRDALLQLLADVLQGPLPQSVCGREDLSTEVLIEHFQVDLPGTVRSPQFDQLLRQCCTIMVDLAEGLPAVNEAILGQVLQKGLSRHADEILAGIKRMHQVSGQQQDAAFEEEYRATLARELDRIVLFGTDDNRSKRYQLSVAYVSLSVQWEGEMEGAVDPRVDDSERPDGLEVDDFEFDLDDGRAQLDILTVEDLLTAFPNLLIRGGAGSGKTTLMQWFAVKLARSELTGPLANLNGSVPVFLRFRDYADLPRPENFLDKTLPMISGKQPAGWMHRQLETGRAVVLLDGLDEWMGKDDALDWVRSLTTQFPNCRLLLTSRPYLTEQFHERLGFVEATLRPMNQKDIDQFVDHWHAAMGKELSAQAELSELPQLADDLKRVVRVNDALRKLATTPLLCAMICALFRTRCRDLPTSRIALYQACRSMFYRRDSERKIVLLGYPRLTDDQKNRLLGVLAYWMVCNGKTRVEESVAARRIVERLKNMEVRGKSTEVLRLYIERIGLLRRPVPGWIDFPHKTFQELFAAEEALETESVDALVNNSGTAAWREVVILAAGLARPTEANELIEKLLIRGSQGQAVNRYFVTLAATCLQIAREKSAALKGRVERALQKVVYPTTMKEAAALSEAQDLVVPFLRYQFNLPLQVLIARARTLALIGTSQALEILQVYNSDHRRTLEKNIWQNIKLVHNPEEYAGLVLDEEVVHCTYSRDLAPLKYFKKMRQLVLEWDSYQEFPTEGLGGLTALVVKNLQNPSDLRVISEIKNLQMLMIKMGVRDACLNSIKGLINLRSLMLRGSRAKDYDFLMSLTELKHLAVPTCQIKDLSVLNCLEKLEYLDLSGCKQVKDFSVLRYLENLKILDLSYTQIQDVTPLLGLKNLRKLTIISCRMLSSFSRDMFSGESLEICCDKLPPSRHSTDWDVERIFLFGV